MIQIVRRSTLAWVATALLWAFALPAFAQTDTQIINNLLNALPASGGIVMLNTPATADSDGDGIYDIEPSLTAAGGVRMTGVNKTLMLNGATLRAIPNSLDGYAIVRMGVGAMDISEARMHKNLRLIGPGIIEGDRYTHTGTTGEQGMCVWFTNIENSYIKDVEVRNCWGDGVYFDKNDVTQGSISHPTTRPIKVGVLNSWIHHNRRNNISIVGAGYVNILDSIIEFADGTGPYAGIDIEPDTENIGVEKVLIARSIIRGNKGPGVEIVNVIGGPVIDVSITQNNITANGFINGWGIKVVDMQGGWLSVTDNEISNNWCDGVYVEKINYPLQNILIASNRIRNQIGATIAYQGGTSCGHGLRFKAIAQADVLNAAGLELTNLVKANSYGSVVWQ